MADPISLSITVTDKAPTKPNFGTPLFAGFHTAWADRVREYAEASDMLDDGFTADDDLYQMALIAKQQDPAPEKFKIGRLTATYTHTVRLIPLNLTAGLEYFGEVNGSDFSFEVQPGDTTALVCDDIVTALTAIAGVTPTDASTHVDVAADDANKVISYDGLTEHLSVEDITTVNGTTLQTDLDEIKDEDNEWYGLALAINSAQAITAAAAWTEANKKIFVPTSADYEITDAGVTDDIASAQVALTRTRHAGIWHRHIGGSEWANVAFLVINLIPDPGSYTPAFKSLAGVTVDTIRSGQETAIEAKRWTTYTKKYGLNITYEGRTPSGRFFDVTRFVDWLDAEIRADVFSLLVNNPKVPFTNAGISSVKGTIEGALRKGVTAGGIDGDSPIEVNAPDITETDAIDRANRTLTPVTFRARLTGALHSIDIRGTLSI